MTPGYRLIALDAKTGMPVVSGFGKQRRRRSEARGRPGDGSRHRRDRPALDADRREERRHHRRRAQDRRAIRRAGGTKRATCAASTCGPASGCGSSTPFRRPGEFGNDTWEKDSWSYTGNTGVWGQISVDEELGLVYLPVEMPTGDYYGGHRPGNGLFGESLVAVDLQTGEAPLALSARAPRHLGHGHPVRADPRRHHGRTAARSRRSAQPTKQACLYVFNRETGEPIWPIEERPGCEGRRARRVVRADAAVSDQAAGATIGRASPIDDLIDFTPELRAEAVKAIASYKIGPIFTPPVASKLEGPLATLTSGFATNWPGGSYDPETHTAYIYSQSGASPLALVVPPDGHVRHELHPGRLR